MTLTVQQLLEVADFFRGNVPESTEITLSVRYGVEGHGLYVWETEAPEEGSVFIETPRYTTAIPPPQTPR